MSTYDECRKMHSVMTDAHDERPPRLHELENEVMGEVWRQGTATVRTVMEARNPHADRPRAYTTYMTIMARLERKGFLSSLREGKTKVYTAAVDRDSYASERAETEVAALVDRYGEAALVNFARQMDALDRKDRDRLRRLARRA
jgi:predicted transcriptional regulator